MKTGLLISLIMHWRFNFNLFDICDKFLYDFSLKNPQVSIHIAPFQPLQSVPQLKFNLNMYVPYIVQRLKTPGDTNLHFDNL